MNVLLRINSTPAGDSVAKTGGICFGIVAAPVWCALVPVGILFHLSNIAAGRILPLLTVENSPIQGPSVAIPATSDEEAVSILERADARSKFPSVYD